MQNPGNTSVIQPWTFNLSFKEQTVLITAIRGCDTAGIDDISKKIVKRIRSTVLYNAGPAKSKSFMVKTDNENRGDIKKFIKNINSYPMHFVLHLMSAAEVIGYCYPKEPTRLFFLELYQAIADAFHLWCETAHQMHRRLEDVPDPKAEAKAFGNTPEASGPTDTDDKPSGLKSPKFKIHDVAYTKVDSKGSYEPELLRAYSKTTIEEIKTDPDNNFVYLCGFNGHELREEDLMTPKEYSDHIMAEKEA